MPKLYSLTYVAIRMMAQKADCVRDMYDLNLLIQNALAETGRSSSFGNLSAFQAVVPRPILASDIFFCGNNFPLPLIQEELVSK